MKPVLRNRRSGRAAARLEKATLVALHSAFSRSCAEEPFEEWGANKEGQAGLRYDPCCGLPLKLVSAGGMASNCPDSTASVPRQEVSNDLWRA